MGVRGTKGKPLPILPFQPLTPIRLIFMIGRKPEGYKDLLVYRRAAELQEETFRLTAQFPPPQLAIASFSRASKTKTLIALADQMDRSARSGTKNIIEG